MVVSAIAGIYQCLVGQRGQSAVAGDLRAARVLEEWFERHEAIATRITRRRWPRDV